MVWQRRSHLETPLRAIWPAICVAALCYPSSAWACDWPPKDGAERFERATDVFVGRVVESPWGRGGVKSSPTFEVRLAVQTRYKGATLSDVTVMPDGDCTFPFVEGESYVVFGSTRLGRFAAATPDEPLLMSDNADARTKQERALAIQYAEARTAGQAVALLQGTVEITQAAPVLEEVRVHVEGSVQSGSAELVYAAPGLYSYGLVLPPGDYRSWVERDGVRISLIRVVRLVAQQGIKLVQVTDSQAESQGRK